MSTLQDDLLEIYNSLVGFSNDTLTTRFPKPIKVWFEKESRLLVFEQNNRSVRLGLPCYYFLDLGSLEKPSYLLPNDYDYLMSNLQDMIASGVLTKNRTLVSPENRGFDVYSADVRQLWKGPEIVGRCRFVSGTSWLFKWWTRRKYGVD